MMSARNIAFAMLVLSVAMLGLVQFGSQATQAAGNMQPLQTFVSTTSTTTTTPVFSSSTVTSTTTSTSSTTTSTTTTSTSSSFSYTSTLTTSTTALSTFLLATTTYTSSISSFLQSTITRTSGVPYTRVITYYSVSTQSYAIPVPGFPLEAIVFGMLVGLLALVFRRRLKLKSDSS